MNPKPDSFLDPPPSSQVLLAAVAVGVGATRPAEDVILLVWNVEFGKGFSVPTKQVGN